VNGKTVTVRRHNAADPDAQAAKDQRKRDAFERRVLAERQRAASPDAYSGTPRRTPGQRRSRKKSGWTRAKSHARKAKRLWRRHKTRAVAHGLLALGWAGGHAARRSAAKARKTCRQWRKRRSK
jgi:hypothetical protein